MLLSPSHVGEAAIRVTVVAVTLGTLVLYLFTPQKTLSSLPSFSTPGRVHPKNITAASGFPSQLTSFWQELALSLEGARPNAPAIKVENGNPSDEYTKYEPLRDDKKPPERLDLTDENELELFRTHYHMRTEAQRLGPSLPYVANTRGIVTTVGGKYLSIFLVSLRMLRRTECDLPVEVFLDDWTQYNADFCEKTLPSLNAKCRILSDIYSKANGIAPPDHFQFKIFSILFSSFQHVLFLDADSFPAHNPTDLFDNAPYTTHGLVMWPDIFGLTVSSHYYHVAGIPEIPVSARYSSETGQLMLNKGVHKESLMMMVYYNYFGPQYYYPLLCQGSHGAGDKETFIPAAEVMGLPWYQVRRGVVAIGNVKNGEFGLVAMAQNDPKADYMYKAPHPSHNHDHDSWPTAVDDPRIKASPPSKPKPFIIHNNFHKLEPGLILRMDGPTRDGDGKRQRMYGGKEGLIEKFGYDVEERLWEAISEVGCQQSEELCDEMKEHTQEVFGKHVEMELQ
jgi:alpha 1,2-mannosyltransferase